MMDFLFNRKSPLPKIVEGAGFILSLILIQLLWSSGNWGLSGTLFVLLVLQYLFIRLVSVIHWYPSEKEKPLGIEVHFTKAVVAASYFLFLGSLFYLFGLRLLPVILMNLLMGLFAMVDGILICFHLQDRHSPWPPNYFTNNRYLEKS